jgi:hypothetical protein
VCRRATDIGFIDAYQLVGVFDHQEFSAFCSSAALVKLKDPVRRVAESMTITLLWAIACLSSISVLMPAFVRKGAAL